MKAYEIYIHPHNVLNPGFGYQLTVKVDGYVEFASDRHPVSGKEFATPQECLEVAAMYPSERTTTEPEPEDLTECCGTPVNEDYGGYCPRCS